MASGCELSAGYHSVRQRTDGETVWAYTDALAIAHADSASERPAA